MLKKSTFFKELTPVGGLMSFVTKGEGGGEMTKSCEV